MFFSAKQAENLLIVKQADNLVNDLYAYTVN